MATSALRKNTPIIHDTSDRSVWTPTKDWKTGLKAEFRKPIADVQGAMEFPADMMIPRSEWQARIQEMKDRKTRTSDLAKKYKIPYKDQGRLPYCWAYSATHTVELARMRMHLPYVPLSACSVGGPIKNFRKDGGWGTEALEYMAKYGVVPEQYWPNWSLNKKLYYTQKNLQIALNYRVTEWWACKPRNLDQAVSLILRGFSPATGYLWWEHEVTTYDLEWIDGDVAFLIRNQWQGFGDDGFAYLQGDKRIPDDCIAPRVVMAA